MKRLQVEKRLDMAFLLAALFMGAGGYAVGMCIANVWQIVVRAGY